jgi:RNA polymerase sigma factor (sigma-70 family)
MARESGSPLLMFIRRFAAARRHSALTDGELLQRFALQHEEAAFTALVSRHGPMVLGVCRTILQDVHDAEDAFQATFLVLVRKSRAIGKPASVASWLHGVAYRLATRARADAARRRARERQAVPMPYTQAHDDLIWRDLRPVLHQEVDRLPERYRLPFVLCYLEGKTNEEAADLLGWPKGTVLSSLSRAREHLRRRLTRRGLTLTGGLLAALAAENAAGAAVPAALAARTLEAALLFAAGPGAFGGIAAPVLTLAEGMLRATLVARLKVTAGILLALTAGGAGAGALVYGSRSAAHAEAAPAPLPPLQLPAAADAPDAPRVTEERARLWGAWRIVSAEQFGRAVDALNGRRLNFEGERCTLSRGDGEVTGIIGRREMKGAFVVEPASPSRIDFLDEDGSLHGIYRLDGRTLTICVTNTHPDDRPTEFTTSPRNRRLLVTLERLAGWKGEERTNTP